MAIKVLSVGFMTDKLRLCFNQRFKALPMPWLQVCSGEPRQLARRTHGRLLWYNMLEHGFRTPAETWQPIGLIQRRKSGEKRAQKQVPGSCAQLNQ